MRFVDFDGWKSSTTLAERAAAVHWGRTAILAAAVVALVVSGWLIYSLTRPYAYPPQNPTTREIELRREGLAAAPKTPPAGLVEANRSASAQ